MKNKVRNEKCRIYEVKETNMSTCVRKRNDFSIMELIKMANDYTIAKLKE